jgi:hypothetical protein
MDRTRTCPKCEVPMEIGAQTLVSSRTRVTPKQGGSAASSCEARTRSRLRPTAAHCAAIWNPMLRCDVLPADGPPKKATRPESRPPGMMPFAIGATHRGSKSQQLRSGTVKQATPRSSGSVTDFLTVLAILLYCRRHDRSPRLLCGCEEPRASAQAMALGNLSGR